MISPSPEQVAAELIPWLQSVRRDLPWRRLRDPYAVWVSEIMLQQTRVDTAAPYFVRWMNRFPNVHSLAAASLDDVLKAWEGLGYYARARNMHRAAAIIVSAYAGEVPSSREALLALPGIGPYTAGAILSIAFGQPEPILDGNVRRVLCRIYDVAEDPRRPEVEQLLWQLAASLVLAAPPGGAGDLNEALMELGAVLCTRLQPRCDACPLASICVAHQSGLELLRPVTTRKASIPTLAALAAVVQRRDRRYLLVRRPDSGLLGGLWGFPTSYVAGDQQSERQLEKAVYERTGLHIVVNDEIVRIRHAYTHFRIQLTAMRCELLDNGQEGGSWPSRWLSPNEMQDYAVAVTDRKIRDALEAE